MTAGRARFGCWVAGMATLAALGAGGLRPLAGQGIPVTVGIGALSTGAGEFDLPLTIDMSARTEKLGSFVMTLRWNPAVLQGLDGVGGSFGAVTVNQDSLPFGVLRLSGANPAGGSGLLMLAVGRFRTLVNDTTTFRVSVQELYAAGTFADLTPAAVPINRLFCGSLVGTYGDVNRDQAVNAADALIVLTGSVGLDVSQFAMGFGDVDNDGDADPRDALLILSYAVGISTGGFRVGQGVTGTACEAPPAQAYALEPAAVEALVGQEVSFYAFALDSTGAALALRNVSWTSSAPGVATVDGLGYLTAMGAGTATISALQNDSVIRSGTVTVLAGRRLHWVDALAGTSRNQLGTAALPFGLLQDAVDAAAGGDTIRVRSGRYAGARVTKRLALVGDTTGGGARPLLVPRSVAGTLDTVLTLDTAGRVELRDLRVDTAYIGVLTRGTDTVLLRGVEVRGTGGGIAGVRVQDGRLVHLAQSRVIGTPSDQYYYYYANDGLSLFTVDRLVVDTSLVSDFTSDGIYASQVDTIVVRGSTLRYNAGSGLAIYTVDTASATHLTFSRNRVEQNQYGGLTGYYVAKAAFDHNVFVGGGYSEDGISLTGRRSTVATFVADSFDIRESGWLSLSQFDSVLVDSVRVARTDYYYGGTYFSNGRVVVVRNSAFRDVTGEALYFAGRGADSSTIVVRNVEFTGPAQASYTYNYGYGVETYSATADVQDATFRSLYMGLYGYSNSRLRVRNAVFSDSYYGIYGGCLDGASTVDVVQMQRIADQGVYAYGCYQSPSSLEVDSLDATDVYLGVYTYSLRKALLQRSRFTDVWTVASLGGDTATAASLTATARGDAFYMYPDSVGSITGSSFACAAGSNTDGIQAQGSGVLTVAGNTVTGDCYTGIYLRSYRRGEARGNTIALSGGSLQHGIQSYQGLGATQAIVGNTISGTFCSAAIRAEGVTGSAVRVDSNTVTNAGELGIWARYGDTVRIRDNAVSGIRGGAGCQTYHAGILLEGYEYQTLSPIIQIQRNRLLGNERGIVLNRSYWDSAVVVVDSNRIVGSDTTGLFVTGYSRVRARFNVIDSTRAVGVLVDRYLTPSLADTAAVILDSNNITRNAKYGVYNGDGVSGQGGFIDARRNWWGDALGPRCATQLEQCDSGSVGDSVSEGVWWNPQLPNALATILPPAPPAFASFALPLATGQGARAATQRERPTARPAPEVQDLPEPFSLRPRAGGDALAGLLTVTDQLRAERSAARLEQLRERQAMRAEEARRRAAREAAAAARRAERRPEEGRP